MKLTDEDLLATTSDHFLAIATLCSQARDNPTINKIKALAVQGLKLDLENKKNR
jgi:hypothetical protein